MTQQTEKKIFTYEEAAALLPSVRDITAGAVAAVDALGDGSEEAPDAAAFNRIVGEWAEQVLDLGVEVKGLWLVDFDSGGGYYCWQYPEPSLQHFHGYEEGFGGRVKLQ